jgi:hypothetical protein
MNNIVKIILGLNILAAGAGIFFGLSKSGKVDEMKKAKDDAVGKVAAASASERALKKEKDAALTAASTKDGEITNLKAQLASQTTANSTSKELIDNATKAAETAQKAAAKANSDLLLAQQLADKVPTLEGKLADYEILGTALDVKSKLDELASLKAVSNPTPKKKPRPKAKTAGEIGTIQSFDSANKFYVINVGSDNGIEKGDGFTIFSATGNKALGKVEISRANPTVSIAIYKKGFPPPLAPFSNGDRVMKTD